MEGHQMKFRYGNVVLGVAATLCLSTMAFAGGPGEEETTEETATAAPAPAAAVEEDEGFLGDWLPGGFSASLALMSDYSFRGISQTQTGFAAQGGVTYKTPIGIYLGMWNSSVNYGPGDDSYLEQDWIAGYTNTWDAFTIDTNFTYLWYPKESDYNYFEIAVKPSYNIADILTVKMNFVYGNDYFGYAGDAFVIGGGLAFPIPLPENKFVALTLDSNVEYTTASQFIYGTQNNYFDWNAGLVVAVHKNLSFDLRYVDTDIGSSAGAITDARFVGGAIFSF
jgi:uncharacterized protein (TIGR02001 family)